MDDKMIAQKNYQAFRLWVGPSNQVTVSEENAGNGGAGRIFHL